MQGKQHWKSILPHKYWLSFKNQIIANSGKAAGEKEPPYTVERRVK